MKKVFVSQPMAGRTDEEILKERERVLNIAAEYLNDETELIDNFFRGGASTPIEYLGKSISLMSRADLVVFAPGWRKGRGCKIERMVAKEYQIPTLDLVIYNMPNKPGGSVSFVEDGIVSAAT